MNVFRLSFGTFATAGFLAASILAPAAHGTVILIDLNENSGAGGPGGTWNTYAVPTDINGSAVRDAGNLLTTITLSRDGTISDNTANSGTNVFNPNQPGFEGLPSWVSATDNDDASSDNFFTINTIAGAQSFTLTFGGLTPGSIFSLDLLAARNSSSALGFYEYSVDGGANWLGFTVLNANGTVATTNGWDTNNSQTQVFRLDSQGYALHRYLNVSGVTLPGTTVTVRVTDGNEEVGTFASLNAMRLTVVPEPMSAMLLLMGGLGVGGFRRLRRRR